MSGSTTQVRNIADLSPLADAANLALLARRGAGELVLVDAAAVRGSGTGGTGSDGPDFIAGEGAPQANVGSVGDSYFDKLSTERYIYGPKTASGWGTPVSLRGPQGPAGSGTASGGRLLLGTGAPTSAVGLDGDSYIDTASVERFLYGPKSGGVWPGNPTSLRGPAGTGSEPGVKGDTGATGDPGKSFLQGSGPPVAGIGINGDSYCDRASAERFLYGPKVNGVWPAGPVELRGPQGVKGDTGPRGADATLGNTSGAALTASGTAGTATTAARSDHTHALPTPADIGAAPAAHSQPISTVTGLQAALDAKSPLNPTLPMANITGLSTALAGKVDTSKLGAASGVATLGTDGKVPAAQLPASTGTGGGSTANLDNGTADGMVPVWNQSLGKYVPEAQTSIVADRDPVVELNAATALTFAGHHRRIVVLSANAPLTLASAQAGSAPFQGFTCLVENDHTAQNTVTFGAGITVRQPANGTGTGGQVKIPPDGQLSVVVYPKGSALIAKCRGDVA